MGLPLLSIHLAVSDGRGRIDQHQAQAVLARELAARAGAFRGGAGEVRHRAVGARPTALDLAPDHRPHPAEAGPFLRFRLILPGLAARRIRGEIEDLGSRQAHAVGGLDVRQSNR